MRINGISKSLNKEIESNVTLFSKFFELQKLEVHKRISHDVVAVPDGDAVFLLTNFNGETHLFDVLRAKNNINVEMLKGDSIKKLLEIKKGHVVHLKDTLVGSVLPISP